MSGDEVDMKHLLSTGPSDGKARHNESFKPSPLLPIAIQELISPQMVLYLWWNFGRV